MILGTRCASLSPNEVGRDFVAGDLHGQRALLERILDAVAFDTRADRLIAIGDLIDRGPDSLWMLEQAEAPWMIPIAGNHEAMLLDATADEAAARLWAMNGGEWGLRLPSSKLRAAAAFVAGFPLTVEVTLSDGRRLGFLHGEVPVGETWNGLKEGLLAPAFGLGNHCREAVLWGRTRIAADIRVRQMPTPRGQRVQQVSQTWAAIQAITGIDRVYAGHTVLSPRVPRGRGNTMFLETGAYESKGRLTLVEICADRYWQVGHWGTGVTGPSRLGQPDPPPESWRPRAPMSYPS